MNPCVFMDRDGVINVERGTYTWEVENFEIIPGVPESLRKLKKQGYLLIVVTNQAGVGRGLYTKSDMEECHRYLSDQTFDILDDIYYATSHPDHSNSLLRKPDSLMFEKAIARYRIDPGRSWMVGDTEGDLVPAKKLGIRTIYIGSMPDAGDDQLIAADLSQAAELIIKNQ
ncbi:MAG: HAD-IIIA family hydrolase [Cyclobacteriaceae bacterium]|nr:HAD-IIIA family hydrolase [Cyclobacteriaceae bacterium]